MAPPLPERSASEGYVADLVKRDDADRWVASLFAPPAARRSLLALAAFDTELGRVRSAVTQPLAGEIRLQWWRDRLEAFSSEPDDEGHPVLAELRAAVTAHRLPLQPFLDTIDARIFDLYDDPMPSKHDFEGYAGETTSAFMRLAALCLDPDVDAAAAELAGHAGVAVALAKALHRFPHDVRRRHLLLPLDVFARHGMTRDNVFESPANSAMAAALADLRDAAHSHAARASALLRATPRAQRAPYLPLALVPAVLASVQTAPDRGLRPPAPVSPLARFARIAWAYRTGRIIGLRARGATAP